MIILKVLDAEIVQNRLIKETLCAALAKGFYIWRNTVVVCIDL